MSLIQRNVISLLVLLAVIGAGVGILTVSSPFASGQESDSCEPGVGISIATTNAAGDTVAVVSDGDDVFYTVRLFKDQTLCDFGGGTLTITLPGATDDFPDGSVTIDLTETDAEGNESDVIVTLAASYNSGQIQYIVNQDDGIQSTASDDSSVELTVRADYSDGHSQDAAGNRLPNEVDATATSIIRLSPPGVAIDIAPSDDLDGDDTQSVLQGQTASFDVVITNTGGFELSNISVASLEDADAGELRVADCERAATTFDSLGVGASTVAYQCGTTTDTTFVQRVQVTAYGSAVDTAGDAVQLEVISDDTTTVLFGTISVGIGITALQDPVRYQDDPEAQEGSFTIVGTTPTGSDLNDVSINVTVTGPGDVEGTAADDCYREFVNVAADDASKPADLGASGYSCSAKMNEGINTIEATIEGTIPGTTVVLSATASTTVEAITPGLTIALSPQDQTIRSGETASISVTVTNGASDLTGVSVVDPNPNNDQGLDLSGCTTGTGTSEVPISLSAIGDMAPNEEIMISCYTAALSEETGYEAVAIGTARDNTTEPSNVATAVVRILSPSTDIGVSLLEGGSTVVQFVVQTVVVTETNDGDSDLTNIYVDVDAAGIGPDLTSMRLTRESPQFVRSYGEEANDDDVLNPGETWEWRVVVIGVAGNVVLLEPGASSIDVTASGYGTDNLGGEVSPETDADEIETQTIPFSVN